jgi:DMSO/TMAO reductase YedYZ molybdopterin-dependent catalytic subunit
MGSDLLGLNLTGSARPAGPSPEDRALAAGLGAALFSFAIGAAMRYTLKTPFVPERVADAIFAVMPIAVVEFGVALLGPYAKRFAFFGCVLAFLVILALLGRLFLARRPSARMVDGLAFGAVVWVVASATVFPVAGGGFFGLEWRPGPWLASGSLLVTGLAYGAALPYASRLIEGNGALAARGARLASRRSVINALATAGVAVVAWELLKSAVLALGIGSDDRVRGGSGVFPDVDGLSREITPVKDFYHISKNVFDPEEPPEDWVLEIAGLVERPRRYTLEELRALPPRDQVATLMCISNQVGGDLIGNATWRGVSLRDLLEEAGVDSVAVDALLTAFDDYTDSISVDRALDPDTLLAYEMNGEPLTATHGAPLRLIVPGIYGMKNVKWLRRIDLVDRDVKGYWQRRGWDDRAPYQTAARIDVARAGRVGEPAVVAGIAFAGDRGIARVEVSTDGGKSWSDAELREPLSRNAWVLWHLDWTPDREGSHTIVTRATDGTGDVQTDEKAPPAPRGSTGWHRVSLSVRG